MEIDFMEDSKWRKFGDILLAIIINLISSAIFLLLTSLGYLEALQIPNWLALLFAGLMLTMVNFFIFRKKEEPVIKLLIDLKMCIDDFEKYFRRPYWAIIPNPFKEEPDFWKYYEDTFTYVFHSWYSYFKERFERSRTDMDIDKLVSYSNEFLEIVKYYLVYAKSFRTFVKKYPIPKHIREQYNTKFVGEFNTIFRPDLIKFLKNLQMRTGKERITTDIGSAMSLEVTESNQD
jgi:hypothetical protein